MRQFILREKEPLEGSTDKKKDVSGKGGREGRGNRGGKMKGCSEGVGGTAARALKGQKVSESERDSGEKKKSIRA